MTIGGICMVFEAVIFDLDQTLIDSSKIKKWRDQLKWEECFKHLNLTQLMPNVRTFLKNVVNKKIGIVTNSSYQYAERLLDYHHIPYSILVAYQTNGNNKPYPDQLLLCAKELEVNPCNCLYIGDDKIDIVAAKIAGFHAVGFAINNNKTMDLIPNMPEVIISNLSKLSQYIQKREDANEKKIMDDLYECALKKKQAGNGNQYFNYLKKASDMGHPKAQYKLSKLLCKNSFLVEGPNDANYYMHEAAMQFVPEAIYELGYTYEKNNKTKVAIRFYRTSANLGLAYAQYRFGLCKLKSYMVPDKLKISYRWMKRSLENGLQQAEPTFKKVRKAIIIESLLYDNFYYEKGNGIYYLGSYLPEQKYEDSFSQKIINVKDKTESAIESFVNQLCKYVTNNLVLCYLPSSNKENTNTGIKKVAKQLVIHKNMDGTDCLIRHTTKEKNSQSGDRSIWQHLDTMMVKNDDLLKEKHILLLDDVTTTGNSLLAGEKLLVEAGALYVTKLALGKTK